MNVNTQRFRNNPVKTGSTAALILLVLLSGMYITTQNKKQSDDFDLGELDPQPRNNSSDNVSDISDKNLDDGISVEITSKVCVEKKNQTGFNCIEGNSSKNQ